MKPNENLPDGEYVVRDPEEARDLALAQMVREVEGRQKALFLLSHCQQMLSEAVGHLQTLLAASDDDQFPAARQFLADLAKQT